MISSRRAPADGRIPAGSAGDQALLQVEGLTLGLRRGGAGIELVRDVSLHLDRAECVGLVGESGCGKSLTALAILDLLPSAVERYGGRVHLAGCGELSADPDLWRQARGRRIAAVFQEPGAALNPVLRLRTLFDEVLCRRRGLSSAAARREALRLLDMVAMPDAAARLGAYPHQLSGGQKQRAMIALALACQPDLLLADEPTTALDVTVQAQILELLRGLQEELDLAVLLITHDLGVVSECCKRVIVMYAGEVVEEGSVERFFACPSHPYSRQLLAAVPRLGSPSLTAGIPGRVPDPAALPAGCVFHPRCPSVIARCRQQAPPLRELAIDRRSRCWLDGEAES